MYAHIIKYVCVEFECWDVICTAAQLRMQFILRAALKISSLLFFGLCLCATEFNHTRQASYDLEERCRFPPFSSPKTLLEAGMTYLLDI